MADARNPKTETNSNDQNAKFKTNKETWIPAILRLRSGQTTRRPSKADKVAFFVRFVKYAG